MTYVATVLGVVLYFAGVWLLLSVAELAVPFESRAWVARFVGGYALMGGGLLIAVAPMWSPS